MQKEEFDEIIRNHPQSVTKMLEALLDEEMNKPEDEIDFERVTELSSAISCAYVPKEEQESAVRSGIEQVLQKNADRNRKKIKKRWTKPIAAACACAAVLFGANAWSVHATGSTLLRLTYSFFTDHVEYQLPSQPNGDYSSMVQSADDPYGMRTECEKDGFSPRVPQYIPDGFELTVTEHNATKKLKYVSFTYKNGKQLISIYFEFHKKDDLAGLTVGIPSDHHNISEMEINGVIVTLSREDEQYNANFVIDQTFYSIFTQNVDYAESERILRSIFE